MARAARRAHGLARVLLVPAFVPPHKKREITPFHHRLAMVETAVRGEEGLEGCDAEGRRGGVSFTVDTLSELKGSHGAAEIFFIIGEDTIPELPLWKDLPRILSLARLVAVNRPGPRQSFRQLAFSAVPPDAIERLERDRVEMEPVPISSREIRQAIQTGEPADQWLPPGVADYIRNHGLYEN
jgi:nicotinate-nucleotide adenylyltransferase